MHQIAVFQPDESIEQKANRLSSDEQIVSIAEKMARGRFSKKDIAFFIGIIENELDEILKIPCQISIAINYGAIKSDLEVDDGLYMKACIGDVQACKWWDMTRRGFRPQAPNPPDNQVSEMIIDVSYDDDVSSDFEDDD